LTFQLDLSEMASTSPLVEGARRMAYEAHHGTGPNGDANGDESIGAAELLSEIGCEETVVAAALLHDVVDDVTTDPIKIEARFGPEVARLLIAMTNGAGARGAAAIYAAETLAGSPDMQGHSDLDTEVRLQHYLATLTLLCRAYPDLPFLAELRRELDRLRDG
jgi:HD domain